MVRTGLANMGIGVAIALVGALVTAVSYSMVSNGGGSYVVAYGAIIVGAWRFLLGLFQVLRGAVSGPDAGSAIPQSPRVTTTAPAAPASMPQPAVVQDPSGTLNFIGWLLIADAAFKTFSLGSLLWTMRAHTDFFYNVPFLVSAIVLPMIFAIGGLAAGTLLVRALPTAIPFGMVFCAASLLLEGYVLWQMLSAFSNRVPWLSWAILSVHLTIYGASLVVLMRASGMVSPGGRTDIPASPGTRP